MAVGGFGYGVRLGTRYSVYQEAQRWRQARAAQTQQYLSNNATIADSFSSAFINKVQGMATLAVQAAQSRTKASAAVLRSKLDKLA